jgi:hypothetical protein
MPLVADVSQWRLVFNPRPVREGFVVEKVALEQALYDYFGIPTSAS